MIADGTAADRPHPLPGEVRRERRGASLESATQSLSMKARSSPTACSRPAVARKGRASVAIVGNQTRAVRGRDLGNASRVRRAVVHDDDLELSRRIVQIRKGAEAVRELSCARSRVGTITVMEGMAESTAGAAPTSMIPRRRNPSQSSRVRSSGRGGDRRPAGLRRRPPRVRSSRRAAAGLTRSTLSGSTDTTRRLPSPAASMRTPGRSRYSSGITSRRSIRGPGRRPGRRPARRRRA